MSALVKRPPRRRYPGLVRDPGDKPDPITVGCWVVVSDHDLERPLGLDIAVDGPEYVHANGHAIGEVWTLAGGERRSADDLTALDMADVISDGASLLGEIRGGRFLVDREARILRVHRAACLARRAIPRFGLGPTQIDASHELASLVALDHAIADLEIAWRDLVHVRLHNLVKALSCAGALWLSNSPGWVPGFRDRPHPRADEISEVIP